MLSQRRENSTESARPSRERTAIVESQEHAMNAMSWNEESGWTAMIEEARALLSIIAADQAGEEIAEDTVSRTMRLTMVKMAGRLAAEISAQLQPATAEPKTTNKAKCVGRLIWI
jgi:hypothetical protein